MQSPYQATIVMALLLGILSGFAPADELGKKAEAVVKTNQASIVTVRVVLDIEFGGQSREHRISSRGVAVSDTGLIMTDIGAVNPNVNVRGPGGRRIEPKVTPSDIKIIFEKDEKEWDAFVAVKDTKRGLIFLQLKNFKPADRNVKPVDFSKSGKAEVGDRVVTVLRLAKGYDYAPCFNVGRIIGHVKKPRKGLLIDRASIPGLPVFTTDGKLVGCHARMKSGLEEGAGQTRGAGQPVILAAKEINAVIKQALKKAAEGEEKAGEEKAEKEEKEEP